MTLTALTLKNSKAEEIDAKTHAYLEKPTLSLPNASRYNFFRCTEQHD